jgi:tetratricopeptide (TPR) repeat protein
MGDLPKVQTRVVIWENGPTQAVDHYTSLLKSDTNNVDVLYGLGTAYVLLGRPNEALPVLDRALQMAPGDGYILRELGIGYFKAKDLDKALAALDAAHVSFPDDTTVLYHLAQIHQQQGNWSEAITHYEKVLKLEPERGELYRDLGEVYSSGGLPGPGHEYFGIYFKKIGRLDTAGFHFRKALEYAKDDAARKRLATELEALDRR